MNYGEIERQTFKTYLAFATLILTLVSIFFIISSTVYRTSNIIYEKSVDLNMESLENLMGTSIWLIDDTYFETFYEENPVVERVYIQRKLPNTLLVQINTSEKIVYVRDNRQSPPKTFILHKNLHKEDLETNDELLMLTINNGPVRDGFFEEMVTLVVTLKKYPINLANIEIRYDGETMTAVHFNSTFNLGSASDLGRKATVVGYYISEEPCDGEVRLVYSEDGKKINAVTKCS